MKIKSIKKFNKVKPYIYYHHRVWTSMSRNALKRYEKMHKANNYKWNKTRELFLKRLSLYNKSLDEGVDYSEEVERINALLENIRLKRFKKMYYSSNIIRKYNKPPKLSPFGKKARNRYYGGHWTTIWID